MRHINRGDQFVVACIDSPATAPAVIAAARHFAGHLRHKGLLLLNVARDTKAEWIKDYNLPYAALQGDWATAIEGLPTAFNAILAVTAVDPQAPRSSLTNPRTLLRAFRNCKIAYLVVDATKHSPLTTHHPTLATALTVDFHRESKEKLIWASYLARFLSADLTVALPQYKDQGLRNLQNNNIRYIDKVFSPLGIKYTLSHLLTPQPTLHPKSSPDLHTLGELRPDLLIALTTDPRATDPLDWLLGTPDRRLLSHPSATPILFLNPRDDLYVLCD